MSWPLPGFDVARLGEGDVHLRAGEEGELGLPGPPTIRNRAIPLRERT
jgi:hypothetical protein